LYADNGGALKMGSMGSELTVTVSSFYQCKAVASNGGYGGAITKAGNGSITVDQCCFRECQSSLRGLAINIGTSSGGAASHVSSISNTNFVGCHEIQGANGDGTLHHENGLLANYKHLNFSENAVKVTGSVSSGFKANSLWPPNGGTWEFKLCTFSNCSGQAVIWSETPSGNSAPTLELCNFFSNSVADSGAILYSAQVGLLVTDCYFGGATQADARIVYCQSTDETGLFQMRNCIFAGKAPESSFWTSNTGNTANSAATSLDLSHDSVFVCPTFTLRPTLTRTPSPTCWFANYWNGRADVKASDTLCCVIVDCFFGNLVWGGYGGAVIMGAGTDRLDVNTTTFLNCRATDRAGAIYLQCLFTEMNRCCIRNATCPGPGTVITGDQVDAIHSFRDSSFVECGRAESSAEGTIYISSQTEIDYCLLNLTTCTLNTEKNGAVIVLPRTERPWALRYCTVLSCCGKDGLDSPSSTDGLVEYCNFYNNVANIGFLWGHKRGYNVSRCVFKNGTGPDIRLENGSSPRFVISHCVFSVDSLPDGCADGSSTDNSFRLATASIFLDHFHTYYCPTASPSRSGTVGFSVSNAVCSSAQLNPTVLIAPGNPPETSTFGFSARLAFGADLGLYPTFVVNSQHFSRSNDLCLTSSFTMSWHLTATDHRGASVLPLSSSASEALSHLSSPSPQWERSVFLVSGCVRPLEAPFRRPPRWCLRFSALLRVQWLIRLFFFFRL
jgi:hypothetical protein